MLFLCGLALQGTGLVTLIGGVIFGFTQMSGYHPDNTGLAIIITSIGMGVLQMGIGSALWSVEQMAQDAKRTAESTVRSAIALEALVARQRPRPQETTETPLPHLKQRS